MLCLAGGVAHSQQSDQFESLLTSAQQAQARSDFQTAAEFYRQAVSLHPEIAELKANLGLMYYQIGKNEEAVEAFRQVIRLKPALFVPNLFLGLAYVKLKRFNDAIPYLKRAALSNPADIQAQLGLGQAYAGTANTRLAIRSYLRATEIDSGSADGWYRLGMSYLEQVEANARVLLTRHKDSAYMQVLMADNFSEQRAFIQAAEAYRKALESPVVPPGTHANYGFVLLNRQDLDGAKREVNAELKTDPGSLMAKFVAARLLIEKGATRQAAGEIQEIWNTDTGFFRANIARFKSGLARPKRSELESVLEEQQAAGTLSAEAVALFRDDAGSGAGNQNPVDQKGITDAERTASSKKSAGNNAPRLYADGKYRQCRDSLAPRFPLLQASDLRLLAWCAYTTGDYGQAFQAASTLALSAPTEAEGLYWETRSAQALATKALRQASLVDSGSPTMHVLLGDVYRQRNAFHDAQQEYRKALVLAPRNTGALFGLSLALLGNNQLDEAFQVAQSALEKDAGDPELNAVMGEILFARDDFSGAEKYLKKSLNTKPEYVPHVHALLGSVYAKTNRTQEAIAELKLALASDKDGHIYYQIARLYLKTGDRDSAEKAFQVSEKLRGEGLNRAAVAIQQSQGDSESQ